MANQRVKNLVMTPMMCSVVIDALELLKDDTKDDFVKIHCEGMIKCIDEQQYKTI